MYIIKIKDLSFASSFFVLDANVFFVNNMIIKFIIELNILKYSTIKVRRLIFYEYIYIYILVIGVSFLRLWIDKFSNSIKINYDKGKKLMQHM